MLLHKMARNHLEDTVSDILWYICKKDSLFAKKLLSQFTDPTSDFTVIDITRNYMIYDGFMPDLTFLLHHNKTNKINYIVMETRITTKQNIHIRKKRTTKQYGIFTNYLNRQNKLTNIQQAYNIPDKCILLCPSYYDNQEEGHVKEFRFPKLLTLLKNSKESATEEIRNELIKYIEEEFETTHTHLNNNLDILANKKELKCAQDHIISLREAMLTEQDVSKSGLWQKDCEWYCYFGIGLKVNYKSKNEENPWLSYDFSSEEDIFSPLKLSFPNNIIKKGVVHFPKYLNKDKFYCDLLIESKINTKFEDIFNLLACDDILKTNIINFTKHYNQPDKQRYLIKYNEFLNAILNYMDRFDDEVSKEYRYTHFEHSLDKKEILLRLNIEARVNGKYHISVVAEPTSSDINKILRMELFKHNELIDTRGLISETETGYEVPYELNSLKEKIRNTFKKLYKS
ncbi:MAG: hypothetical protein K9K37_00115 [Desulfocapsa sp.]|nr:hypothetical protein [Desulfocapsa sp.]